MPVRRDGPRRQFVKLPCEPERRPDELARLRRPVRAPLAPLAEVYAGPPMKEEEVAVARVVEDA